jgi:hypothetical protein
MARPKNPRRPIDVGDRFLDTDWRREGRVVQVREVKGLSDGTTVYHVEVEVHPRNPEAIGRKTWVSEEIMYTEYRRISA